VQGSVFQGAVNALASNVAQVQVMVVTPDEMWDKLKEANEQEERDWSIVTPAVKEAVMKNVRRRMTPQPLKIRADLEMTCFTYGGVEHIKVCPYQPSQYIFQLIQCQYMPFLHLVMGNRQRSTAVSHTMHHRGYGIAVSAKIAATGNLQSLL
jgi:hypothetical protein